MQITKRLHSIHGVKLPCRQNNIVNINQGMDIYQWNIELAHGEFYSKIGILPFMKHR